jgi:hypothetical protein
MADAVAKEETEQNRTILEKMPRGIVPPHKTTHARVH